MEKEKSSLTTFYPLHSMFSKSSLWLNPRILGGNQEPLQNLRSDLESTLSDEVIFSPPHPHTHLKCL